MRGFVCIAQGCFVNEDLIDKDKSHYDPKTDKVVVCDYYGNTYLVDKTLIKGKIKV